MRTRHLAPLVLATVAGMVGFTSQNPSGLMAASTGPLVSSADLVYVGAFKVPHGKIGASAFGYDGQILAYNIARNSLFAGSYESAVAEISIPTPVNSASLAALPTASVLEPFTDPTEGQRATLAPGNPTRLGGLLVYGRSLIGTTYIYYDANNSQRQSHYVRSTDLTAKGSFKGFFSVGEPARTGTVSGYMASIPSEWRAAFGGPALTGQCCVPIVTRTSFGPSVSVFDPSQLASGSAASKPVLLYPQSHPLSPWGERSELYNGSTQVAGAAFPSGTSSVLFFGVHGYGDYCYGFDSPTNPPPPPIVTGGDTVAYCYDPMRKGKGNHAYPYRLNVWAYDANDLAAVARGAKQSWEPQPYATWELPTPFKGLHLNGVAYDRTTQRIFIAQQYSDGNYPVIAVYRIANAPPSVGPESPTNVRIVR